MGAKIAIYNFRIEIICICTELMGDNLKMSWMIKSFMLQKSVGKMILLICDIGVSTNIHKMSCMITIVTTVVSTITHKSSIYKISCSLMCCSNMYRYIYLVVRSNCTVSVFQNGYSICTESLIHTLCELTINWRVRLWLQSGWEKEWLRVYFSRNQPSFKKTGTMIVHL